MLRSKAMTIGQLSRRTGVPIKALRTYEDLGFLFTRGRSEGNYRLFGEETLPCVQVVQRLRSLGLTLKEIQALIRRTCQQPDSLVERLLDEFPGAGARPNRNPHQRLTGFSSTYPGVPGCSRSVTTRAPDSSPGAPVGERA